MLRKRVDRMNGTSDESQAGGVPTVPDVVEPTIQLLDLHWEIRVPYSVPDDRSLINRLRWRIWMLTRFGSPPTTTRVAVAREVTTVPADAVSAQMDWPNRQLSKLEPHRPRGNTAEVDVDLDPSSGRCRMPV